MSQPPPDLFRREAFLYHANPEPLSGDVLRLPRWMGATFWFIALVTGVAVAFAVLGRVNEYAMGPALVRIEGQRSLRASTPGSVSAIECTAGQEVQAGQVLFRLQGAQEEVLRAPRAAVVGEVWVEQGQLVAAGEPLASLAPPQVGFFITALLPGHFRPMIHEGASLRLELSGFPYAYQELRIRRVHTRLVAPRELPRLLGSDAVSVREPSVLVEASLPSGTFEADGSVYAFHEGMQGTVSIAVRTDSILETLFPWLKIL